MTLMVRFGQTKWNWPRGISPVGSNGPAQPDFTGPYWLENQPPSSSTYASFDTSTTFEKPGWATWQW
jgi:hypothetical protein